MAIFPTRLIEGVYFRLKALVSPMVLGASGLVLDARGHVLLVRHSYRPGWYLPGGGVAIGETTEAALRRELSEEVGLSGGTTTLLGIFTARALGAGNVVAFYRVEGAVVAFRPNLEIREICWADPAAPPEGVTPATARRLAELMGVAPTGHW